MAEMHFGTGRPPTDLGVYGRWARIAEDEGFELIVASDSPTRWADPFVALTVASHQTYATRLMACVADTRARHVSLAAAAGRGLQQATGGRFMFGLGAGDSVVGERPATVAETRAYATAVRDLTAGETVGWGDECLAMRWNGPSVPVYLAAEGPAMQYLAGQVADGVILAHSLVADDMEMALATIEAGAESAGRTLDDIEIWGMVNVIFAQTEHDGLDDFLSDLGGPSPLRRFRLDCPAAPDHVRQRIEALEQTHDRYIQDSTSTLVLERQDVTCRPTIAGPPEACVERLLELGERGLTHLILPQVMADREEWMRTFAHEVLPFVT